MVVFSISARTPASRYKIADDPTEGDPGDDTDTYRSLACLACLSVHLINPTTGNVFSEDD
jgi:hypothetical protein